MRISNNGLTLIKRFEGFSATVYKDAAGKPTIGYGHLIRPGERFTRLTRAQATELLRRDVTIAEKAVRRHVRVRLTQNQFDALVSFTFNLGEGQFRRSTLLKRVKAKNHARVPMELTKWVHAGGRPLLGLARRRVAEARLYVT